MRKCLSDENEEALRLFIIAAACVGAVLTTIFSLTHGIFEVFPFLYILPIILMVYFYPKKAVLFSLGISLTYISLIYFFGFTNPHLIAIATAWFAIFITIGIVASSYANQLIEEQGPGYETFLKIPRTVFSVLTLNRNRSLRSIRNLPCG